MIISVLLLAILVLFVITLIVGYVYVSRTDEEVDRINITINKINASLTQFQKNSNHRWNITFALFDKVSSAVNIVADKLQDNQVKNLNLTKFNRAALLDSNIMIHKLWQNLTGINVCDENPLSNCIKTDVKNITQLVTNYSASAGDIDAPKPAAPAK